MHETDVHVSVLSVNSLSRYNNIFTGPKTQIKIIFKQFTIIQ